ncbi:hypothetical protein [Methylocystis echinoides]|uniref:Uncharacterized protein n=1 Tax=Methylocystis echinoides TaxID=29468 RepID=A0A9W6GSJ8_9HYPH|nr:hypothetical protein [Methylocystis echinoides]GLI92322.1 hypothetical protein LMG27198_13140 [Methylocystis echinoides]
MAPHSPDARRRLAGSDDWSLIDEQLGAIARVCRMTGGPQDGQWFWAVQIDELGRPWNSGSGNAPSGQEAKAAVERILADFTPRRICQSH